MRISDWSSDVCSADLPGARRTGHSYSPRRKPQKIQHLVRKRRSRTNGSLRHSFDPSSVIEKLLLDFYPGANDAVVYNHDVFVADYAGGFSRGEPVSPGKSDPSVARACDASFSLPD